MQAKDIYKKLRKLTFSNDDQANTHVWADNDKIGLFMNQAVYQGEIACAHYIAPTSYGFLHLEKIKEIAKHICKRLTEDKSLLNGHYVNSLDKPFIFISNTDTVLGRTATDTNTTGGSHWISCVLLPRSYMTINGETITNQANKYQMFLFDSQGIIRFPLELKDYLTNGTEFIEDENVTQLLPFCEESEIDFYDSRNLPTGNQMNGSDCGWWSIYYALMTAYTGNVEFLSTVLRGEKLSAVPLRRIIRIGETLEAKPKKVTRPPTIITKALHFEPKSIFVSKMYKDVAISHPYLSDSTVEDGHPNQGRLLSKIIEGIKEFSALEEFHEMVYASLWKDKRFINTHKLIYAFRYVHPNSRALVIGETNNLVFWLLANKKSDLVINILNNCENEISTLKDSKSNNILHIAAFFHDIKVLGHIMKTIDSKSLRILINERNEDGTNPLGMLFFNTKLKHAIDLEALMGIVRLFIANPFFKINAYLNDKKGRDYKANPLLRSIGGYNCLHMAIIQGYPQIITLLTERNENSETIDKTDLEYAVNFRYPTLNPAHHMTSPQTLLEKEADNHSEDTLLQLTTLLNSAVEDQISQEDADTSGDSDDEESSAFFYKQVLLSLNNKAEKGLRANRRTTANGSKIFTALNTPVKDVKEIMDSHRTSCDQIVIPHFHGVPFMDGHSSNAQRREIARILLGLNNEDIHHPLSGLHSRTSTTCSGIENFYQLIKASEGVLDLTENADKRLIRYLSECWKKNQNIFLDAVSTYVYDFSDNPIKKFWDTLEKIMPADSEIVKYRFPFLPTSKAPDHPVKFGIGQNVEMQERGEKALHPLYNSDSRPQHRLAGLLYITFHSINELVALEDDKQIIDLPKLLKSDQLHSKNILTDHQIETVFLGGISSQNIVAVIPIVYPNFSKAFKKGYHDNIWGLTPTSGRGNPNNAFPKAKEIFCNEELPKFYVPEITPAGRALMPGFTTFALKIAEGIAASRGQQLCYMSSTGKIYPYPTSYDKSKHLSQAQVDIKSEIETKKGSSGKIKISVAEQNTETVYKKVVRSKLELIKKHLEFEPEFKPKKGLFFEDQCTPNAKLEIILTETKSEDDKETKENHRDNFFPK